MSARPFESIFDAKTRQTKVCLLGPLMLSLWGSKFFNLTWAMAAKPERRKTLDDKP